LSIPLRRLRANPCTMHLFPPLPIPFCFLSHLTVAPSSLYHRRFLTFLFVLYKPSAYWIRLSLFQGNPSHSFLLLTVSSFIATLFSRTPFGTYSTRLELILEKSTIHSFCSSGQPEFYNYKRIRTRRTRDIDLRERSLASTSRFQQSDYSSYRLPLRAI
jgi:hypothetical protein